MPACNRRLGALSTLATLLALPLTAYAQGSCTPQLAQPPLVKAGTLMAAINPTVAPIQYINDAGQLVGLDVDFGDMIAKRLCLKMEFVKTAFASMIPALKDGRFDMIDTFMYYTPERASQVLMVPYGAATLAIVVQPSNKAQIKGIDDFAGKRFAVQLGSIDEKDARAASAALVKAGHPAIEIHSFPNYSDVLQAVIVGQADGGFVGTEQSYYYRDKEPGRFRIAVVGLYPHAEALAFKEPAVAKAVVGALNAMKKDGSFDKLFASYHHCTLPPPYKVTTGPIPQPDCPAQAE